MSRIKSAIKRRIKGGVRVVHARLRYSGWLRRIAVPLLQRFPQLKERLRLLSGAAAPVSLINRKALADWPAPLPEEYLHMPESSRKVLLDLARTMQRPPNS